MNAERLHAIAQAIQRDLEDTGAVSTMSELNSAVANAAAMPQEPQYEQQLSAALERLEETLPSAPSNNFPPTWIEILDQFEVRNLLGNGLLEQVQGVLRDNQVTPSIAAARLEPIATDLGALQLGVTQLLDGLDYFEIGAEEVQPGTAEVSVLIPRSSVDNQLQRLGREFVEIERLMGPFMELASGSRQPLAISQISSSDLGLAVDVAPQAAALLAVAAERVLAGYKNILEIRRLRRELSDEGLDDRDLQGVDARANSRMEETIESAANDLIARSSGIESYRQNELRVELKASLNSLANRIDRGYNIDVRASEQAVADDDEEDQAASDDAEALRLIIEVSPNLRFIERAGEPILALPEGNVDPEDDTDGAPV